MRSSSRKGGITAVALAIILNFVITGFLCGYLITRLFLASAFILASGALEVLRKQTEKAKDLEKESDWGRALNAFEAALAQVTPSTPKPQELLRLMWDPSSPIKSPEDNDLEVFFNDPDFKALLGS